MPTTFKENINISDIQRGETRLKNKESTTNGYIMKGHLHETTEREWENS